MANRVRSTALIGGVAVVAVFLLMVQRGQAQTVASDRAAGYVVFPKVVVDAPKHCTTANTGGVAGGVCLTDADCLNAGTCSVIGALFGNGPRVDTLIQLTNTSPSAGCQVVECAYINATKHCTNSNIAGASNGACRTNADCVPGGTCGLATDWQESNFFMILSGNQPVAWSANSGGFIPPDADACADGQPIQAAPEAFFVGEVKCVAVDGTAVTGASATTGTPIAVNDLKGEVSIYDMGAGAPGGLDVRAYNGIGIQSTAVSGLPIGKTCVGGSSQGDPCATDSDCSAGGACEIVMCLGSNPSTSAVCPAATYASCPSTLILNHFFDGAPDQVASLPIHTDLTLVPCSEDLTQTGPAATPATTAQFQVFNEFEQRFSASLGVRCFSEVQLSHIDTLPGNEAASIFSMSVQGTLAGQTRIHPVIGAELNVGHGLLGVAEEFIEAPGAAFPRGSDAFNLNYSGTTPAKSDVVVLPPNTTGP
jgi:hypothetical protein